MRAGGRPRKARPRRGGKGRVSWREKKEGKPFGFPSSVTGKGTLERNARSESDDPRRRPLDVAVEVRVLGAGGRVRSGETRRRGRVERIAGRDDLAARVDVRV